MGNAQAMKLSGKTIRLKTPQFPAAAGRWHRDGSVRDIYLHDIETVHWDRFDQLACQYACTYTFDGKPSDFPGSRGVLANREGTHHLLISLGGPFVNCMFYIPGQLEMHVDPRDVTGRADHERVLAFVRNLAVAIGKPAHITPEMAEDTPLLTYDPDRQCWLVHPHRTWHCPCNAPWTQ